MRFHTLGPHQDGDTVSSADELYEKFLGTHEIHAEVAWGDFNSETSENHHICIAEFRVPVRGLGRPDLQLLASDKISFHNGKMNGVETLALSWNVDEYPYPEYLLELIIRKETSQEEEGDLNQETVLRRVKHVLPLPGRHLDYTAEEVLWAPGLFEHEKENKTTELPLFLSSSQNQGQQLLSDKVKRRGFGLELETVQLPPDYEKGNFTKLEEYRAMVKHMAKIYHKSQNREAAGSAALQMKMDDNVDMQKSTSEKHQSCVWDRLLLWDVGHDPQVENATPQARIDLFHKLMDVTDSAAAIDNNVFEIAKNLVLGGRSSIPDSFLSSLSDDTPPSHSQTSPEYKSPLPPNELFHVFPPPNCGYDEADCEISLLLDGVLKNENNPCAVPILAPTISDIGQSASSIHIHVNVINPTAWPRVAQDSVNDLQSTRSLLAIVFNWIRFDGVIRKFARPWMWRDRSLSPMFAAGPEFMWHEVAWKQGSTVLDEKGDVKLERCNIPAFFRHAFETYSLGVDADGQTPLFGQVFDDEVLRSTLYRWCSLNLLSLKKFGTVEIRRMDATLDSNFVNAWSWFCVGFVEKFGDPKYFDKFAKPYLDDASGWREGLEKLIEAQNNSTIEDLMEIMACEKDCVVPQSTFATLMNR
jgi:hypothetical protein